MTNDKFAKRSGLEEQLDELNKDIHKSLVPLVLDVLTTYEEYEDNIPDLVYGMPESKLIKRVQQRDERYKHSDIREALRVLEAKKDITSGYYSSDGQYLHKPTYRNPITCKKENVKRMQAVVKTINDIFD
ncbi:hypothetical protein HY639_04425 [Candidatus Woesearchaeota archaeon]|nr:hypothetical protein [Candidatus Woesearchaeota archaeon]